ncbi:hypothetical protein [Verrucomicrobium spinosum]|uniref:hypothetical protein n=1 Tax=Verrucomicrobium spinosum TaxID=2736 RepID=UPI001C460C26|nr:hypothetical protein [Verrucomicrobium spinosum]
MGPDVPHNGGRTIVGDPGSRQHRKTVSSTEIHRLRLDGLVNKQSQERGNNTHHGPPADDWTHFFPSILAKMPTRTALKHMAIMPIMFSPYIYITPLLQVGRIRTMHIFVYIYVIPFTHSSC